MGVELSPKQVPETFPEFAAIMYAVTGFAKWLKCAHYAH
jgi:hypothetical protein